MKYLANPNAAGPRPSQTRTSAASGADLVRSTRRRFARALGVGFVIAAGANLAALLVPLYNMQLFNVVLTTRNTNTLFWLTAGFGLVLAVHFLLTFLGSLLYEAVADRVARTLSLPSLLTAARIAEEGATPQSGQAIRDLGELRSFVSGDAIGIPLDLVWSPFLLAALFVMHWAYGIVALVCSVVLVAIGLVNDLLSRRPLREANDETIRAFSEISVAVRHAEAVEGLGMLPALARRWRGSQEAMLEKLWRGTRIVKVMTAATKSSRLMMTGLMVCAGIVLCIDGQVSGGSMVAANMILAKMLLPVERIVGSWRSWISAAEAWRRVVALLTETHSQRGTIPLPCRNGKVVVDRLVYIAQGGERPVLRGITFEVEPGEVLGIIGPSGAGKSTLARIIVGAAQPTAGGVWLDGNNTWTWERGDFGRHVGYMPQTTAMLEGSIGDNIARMREADPTDIIAAAVAAGIHETIMQLPNGYATPIGEAGFVLSGGQRQKLALARALFGKPKMLVLDEPNSALDDEGERALQSAIDGAREHGTTVLMIAHRPSLVALADKLLVLKDGMIDRFGARDAVLRALKAPSVSLVKRADVAEPARIAAT